MKTYEEVYDILFDLNEQAHAMAFEDWMWADEQDDEDLREDASSKQQAYFRELFQELDDETRISTLHYRNISEDLRSDFESWYGVDK